jgi:hypothetical protein
MLGVRDFIGNTITSLLLTTLAYSIVSILGSGIVGRFIVQDNISNS